MQRFRAAFLTFLTLVLLGALSFSSLAEPPAPAPPPPKPSPLAPITSDLNQKFQSILGGNAAAATTTSSPAAAPPANGIAATTTSAENPAAATDTEPSETFGTKALNLVLGVADLLAEQSTIFVDNFADLPQVSEWYNRQTTNTRLVDLWHAAGVDLLLVVGVAFAGGFAVELLLTPARRLLRRRKPADIIRRLTTSLGLLAVELMPVIIFIAMSLTLLDQHETHRLPRFVVLNVVYAIALNRLVMILGDLLLAPRAETLRLLPLSQPQASYLFRWLRLYSFVTVYGYFCVDVARSLHVPEPAVAAFGSLLGLVLIIMTIIIIVQKRAYVAVLLRGHLSAAQRDLTLTQSMRLWLARSWHVLAIAYLVIGYLVTALSVEGGFAILLRGTILTFLVFVATGMALHTIRRFGARYSSEAAPQLHHTVLRFFLRLMVWILMITGIAAAWGVKISDFLATNIGQRISGSLFSIGTTVVVLALIYGYVTTITERHLNRKDKDGRPVPASARVRTLLPMLRNAMLIAFLVIAGLVILSEAGFNMGPLLAGAGVIGVAVGFGSQTLVKDFLTGLFIVIENTIAIGDVVKIGDHSGTVEGLSIRTLRLRDADGGVHILPFSEVSQIINMTKDFAYALMTVGVSYDSNLRHVMDVMKAVGDEMQQDPKLRSSIIDPIEVLGVDSFGDSAIKIQARIRTRPGRQWDVKRAFLLRLKERFDAEKIEIPFPTVTNMQKPGKT